MKKLVYSIFTVALLTSCVTKQRFTELSDRYDELADTNADLIAKNDKLIKEENSLNKQLKDLQNLNSDYINQAKILNKEIEASLSKYKKLQDSYDALASNSSSTINAKAKENQKLLSELEEKETALFEKEANLAKLTAALDARSKRIQDLEALIASKEAAMQELKSAISNALKGFEGKGLTVEQRDGKVYVSMENKLLFGSGQWAVGANGKSAVVELAKVLVQNPTIDVLIEGHTDDDPYRTGGVIQDNWDLSVKRATAIVRILQENSVSPKQITAAGHGEYVPVAPNTTPEGKAKNRRIEIILSPNLDEVTKLLNE
ncbi:OmpA family protein [Wenyingzhuangia marina]|uniref:Chemotaxis protein MotB n=1 Tax=Wenyingzhuangia marina TaxID=1195760 RepID=A0A1M5T0A7_9FLAO|nr:OmpA family protein [Wenyingzhuangia marina]GGF64839.1 cell envelope biogenesis protein OmpA [Wenyingzhuangia marina]SHH44038.1 chemotaxis protein MotB [Wenyingzhuangia marina]